LHQTYSKHLLSPTGIKAVLIIYTIYFFLSIWGITNLQIDFKNTYFISGGAYVKQYLDRSDIYYKSGNAISIITEGLLDFSQEQT